MKHRITYLLHDGEPGIDPSTIKVTTNSVTLPPVKAAQEWRLTMGLSELPTEVQQVLEHSHEIHIRWATEQNYKSTLPLLSRVASGLHVFYTPRNDSSEDKVCPLLEKIFGHEVKCDSVKESFSSPAIISGSERFAHTAAFQYHQLLSDLEPLAGYIGSSICAAQGVHCGSETVNLEGLTTLDIDFDAISHAVTLTGMWAEASEDAFENFRDPKDRVEVGVLNTEKATEPEELSLGGFLTVIGEDTKPSATLFSFPSRYQCLPGRDSQSYNSRFSHPTGLHPTLQINLRGTDLSAPDPTCSLHAYLTLPSALFIDRYQFTDKLFLSSHNLTSLRTLSGATDLEAPDWVVPTWGSASLFSLSPPPEDAPSHSASIPLHLRYLSPNGTDTPGQRELRVPDPLLFWACRAEDGLKMASNPFDRTNVGYDGLFGPKTLFYHVPSAKRELVSELQVPVMDLARTRWVEVGTAAAVVLGFLWVLFKLVGGGGGGGSGSGGSRATSNAVQNGEKAGREETKKN